MTYAQTGSPFNFLGNFSESQKLALASWIQGRMGNFPAIQLHHQVRAQQLRKTAGMLEAFYAGTDHGNIESLAVNFQKETWQPGPHGHWAYGFRNDHLPAMTMVEIKKRVKYQMERADEAVFHMKHLRNQIEVQEDKAQHAKESLTEIPALMNKIEAFFGLPEYQMALPKDITNLYKGQPLARVNQLDTMTPWEMDQHNHGHPDSTLTIKG